MHFHWTHSPPWGVLPSSSLSIGRGAKLLTFRRYSPFAVFTVTVRTTPSDPGCTWNIRPSIHCIVGKFCSFNKTSVPISRFFVSEFHFGRVLRVLMYSLFHCCQKSCFSFTMCCHNDKRFVGVDDKSTSGKQVNESPIRKCPGVKARRSFGSLDNWVMGREFITASMPITSERNWSLFNTIFLRILFKWCLNILTAASQRPPKFGESGGI